MTFGLVNLPVINLVTNQGEYGQVYNLFFSIQFYMTFIILPLKWLFRLFSATSRF